MARPLTTKQRQFFLAVYRSFSTSCRRPAVRDVTHLPARIRPSYCETKNHDLLSLRWPSPPRNIMVVKKEHSQQASQALIEFTKHISSTYPSVSILAESHLAEEISPQLPFDVFAPQSQPPLEHANSAYSKLPVASPFHDKVDLVATFGGDGTILHASSLFSSSPSVPPIISFSMGTLGFLGEFKFDDYRKAFREAYFSGAPHISTAPALAGAELDPWSRAVKENTTAGLNTEAWGELRGKHLGRKQGARVLLRHRLKVQFSNPNGHVVETSVARPSAMGWSTGHVHHAMNEVLLHRGAESHLMHISVSISGRLLTEAVADGMLVSTPTGSTAYSLSAGGSIIHPLVPSLLLTPVCPRSLSFRPLVLPANAEVVLRLGEKNRGREVEVSVDGDRRREGAGVGMEVRVTGEPIEQSPHSWTGGVPCLIRGSAEKDTDDGWVGGLNGLLKWNYPFGEEM